MAEKIRHRLAENTVAQFLIAEYTVITLIFINTLVLFLDEFPDIHQATNGFLLWVDYTCIIYFIIEALLKIYIHRFSGYWAKGWNRFDFMIVIASLPALLSPWMDMQVFSIFFVLRLGRLMRFFRVIRFIPNAEKIFSGVMRSLKASVGIFIILFILNLAFALGATLLFRDLAPDYFGNPLTSTYTLFKVFTIEGWFDIPDMLVERGASGTMIVIVRLYFVAAVLIGGLLGLSLANAVFVDEMTADNTDRVEAMVSRLHERVDDMHGAMAKSQQRIVSEIQAEMREMRHLIAKSRNKP